MHKTSIAMTVLLAAIFAAAALAPANAKPGKHGKHWHHFHGEGSVRALPLPTEIDALSPAASFAQPGEISAMIVEHTEWCGRTYQTYDRNTDTYLRYDGVRVACLGP